MEKSGAISTRLLLILKGKPLATVEPRFLHGWGSFILRPSNPGSFAMFTAIRRASSLVSSFAAARRPGSSSEIDVGQRLPAVVADDKGGFEFVDLPGRWEAAAGHQSPAPIS